MFYRVIRSKDDNIWFYDFDDLYDALSWIDSESYLDKHSINPIEYQYRIVEIG